MSTKCIAFSNNDVILVAWTFAHKLEDCVGCDVRRIPAESANVRSGEPQGQSLPAMAGFPGDPNAGKSGRTTAQAPIQKLFWKDLAVKDLASPGPYIYQVIPLKGTFDEKGVQAAARPGDVDSNASSRRHFSKRETREASRKTPQSYRRWTVAMGRQVKF
ncbi:hypothetical protein ACFSHT_40145 [Paraburkholderia silviterrae]|uniref:Uncharacterized protein n=1 Tax=Paraburkholderia silviterrae TaxID=2528715 RepID=A0A4V2ZXT0_9BURK|nr:hypothetical protein [Paraburkholderia silviterrae]TDG16606.1 hypothetical protein EYW47_40275 [Paraburkholderia silviterrae]